MSVRKTVILERRFVPKGTLVVREGEPGSSAYLIQSGDVEVFTEHDGRKIKLAELGVGQIFGEMALIFDGERSANVRATSDCNLIIITRQAFQEKLKKTDSTVKAIVEMLTTRIVSGNNTVVMKQTDLNDLMETTHIIYQNVLSNLPGSRQSAFQDKVLPKLDEFLEAVRSFRGD
jgi:CRP-like cAMP-binding protein